ncbi:MAG: YchJ family protein [Aureispira sp.]
MRLEACPCGSGNAYAACCQPIIENASTAPTAESLMRARYTAHVLNEADFIVKTTHVSTYRADHHQEIVNWVTSTTWKQLDVLETHQGGTTDEEGYVLFRALYEQDGVAKVHDEYSYFKKEEGVWYFVQGRPPVVKNTPVRRQKVARNAPCPCGSGKKYKRCCA